MTSHHQVPVICGPDAAGRQQITLTEVPIGLLEQPDVLDKMGDARRGLVEYLTTPGAAVTRG